MKLPWTRLGKTAEAGSRVVTLLEAVDWRKGDEIVIAATSYEPHETETFRIMDIDDLGREITLNSTMRFRHLGE